MSTPGNPRYVNREAMVEAVKQLRGDGGGDWQMGYERAQADVLALLGEVDIPRTEVTEP